MLPHLLGTSKAVSDKSQTKTSLGAQFLLQKSTIVQTDKWLELSDLR